MERRRQGDRISQARRADPNPAQGATLGLVAHHPPKPRWSES
jgi:hypothetical protein